MRRWLHRIGPLLFNRNGASTVEYVAVIAGAALLASILYFALTSTETQQTIQTKIQNILNGEATPGDGTSGEAIPGTETSDTLQPTKNSSDNNESTPSPVTNDSPSEDKPGFLDRLSKKWNQGTNYVSEKWDQGTDYVSRKGKYLLDKGGQLLDYTVDSFKEELNYAIEDPIGWWFWDDLKSAWNGKDARTGEDLNGWERLDRGISGIPIGVGKAWKYGSGGVKGLVKGGKKVPDVLKGLACAKKKEKSCENKSAPKHDVANALKDFKSKHYNLGGHELLLDKKGMKHILERHHPKYYNAELARGKQKTTFFDDKTTVEDISNIIDKGIKDNREEVINRIVKNGGRGQIEIKVDGKEYVLGFSKYRVGQLYPK